MRTSLLPGLVLAAVVIAATTFTSAHAFAAPAGPVTTSVASGDDTTVFSISPPVGAACSGSGADGYRWHAYVTNVTDSSTLSFTAAGPSPVPGAFVAPLHDSAGDPVVDRSPASAPLGLITVIPTFSLGARAAWLENGVYNIGFACTLAGVVENDHYWEWPIVVTRSNGARFDWAYAAAPPTPKDSVAVMGDGVISGYFQPVIATLTPSEYRITATAIGGLADPASPRTLALAGAGVFWLPAQNGTEYEVSFTASNSVGTSPPFTYPLRTPSSGLQIDLRVTSGTNGVVLEWTTSGGEPWWTIRGFDIFIDSPGASMLPGFAAATDRRLELGPDFPPGVYTVRLQARFVGLGYGESNRVGFEWYGDTPYLVQDIQTVRPQGALVLTQKCGVFGSADLYADTTFGTLAALPPTPGADADLSWWPSSSPTATGTAPTQGAGGAADPLFPQYPYPVDANGDAIATYPTNCAIDLGTGRLITSGPRAGQYFRATGRIAQVTVVNTRDADSGWTLNGRMSNFTSTTDATDTFSGNLLGWDPKVTWDSNPNLDFYDMTVIAGGVRQPQPSTSTTGLGDPSNSTNTTLASSLAQSPAGSSLGMAVMDARLRLLVPVTADAGTYRGTLTFTTI